MKLEKNGLNVEITPLDFWDWKIAEKIGKWNASGNIIYRYTFPNFSKVENDYQTFTMQVTKVNDEKYHLHCYGWSREAYKTFYFTEEGYAEACKYIERERLKIIRTLAEGMKL